MVVFGKFVEAKRGLILGNGPVQTQTPPMAAGSLAELGIDHEGVEACRRAQAACLEMAGYCVRMQGYYAELGHVRLLEDCARLCEVTVDFLLRGSEMRGSMLALCAEVCRRCARDCRRFDYDRRLLGCAEICERCAETCQPLAA